MPRQSRFEIVCREDGLQLFKSKKERLPFTFFIDFPKLHEVLTWRNMWLVRQDMSVFPIISLDAKENTMDLVSNMLGIDKVNMGGKLILIEERHETDANFLLSSIILDALKKNYNICLVLFHNTFNHFHNVSIKFGCNLAMLRKEGKVKVVEPMKIVAAALQSMDKGTVHKLNTHFTRSTSDNSNNIVHHLLTAIKNEYHAPAVIVIDDLSHLYNLGFHLRDVVYCMRYLRSLIECNKESQLCIVVHTYEHESQSCVPDTFVDGLKHMSHLFLAVEPFETGYSSDMSGKLTVNWRIDCIRRKYNWSETVRYVYKLLDHQVKVYTPGNVPG